MTDYDLLRRYVQHVRRLNRGDDLLGEFCGMPDADRLEIRRIADAGQANATGPTFERVGGQPPGTPGPRGWFAKSLEGLRTRSRGRGGRSY
jgi:hypothetical protein